MTYWNIRDAVNPVSVAVCQLQLNEFRKSVNCDGNVLLFHYAHVHYSLKLLSVFFLFLKEMIIFFK